MVTLITGERVSAARYVEEAGWDWDAIVTTACEGLAEEDARYRIADGHEELMAYCDERVRCFQEERVNETYLQADGS